MDLTPKKHSGTRNEMVACIWLLKQGYDVFQNISPHGDVDIIALKDGVPTFIDVKAANYTVQGARSLHANRLKESQVAASVVRLNVYFDGHCEFVQAVTIGSLLEPRHCKQCGETFKPRDPSQIFCKRRCTQTFHYTKQTGKIPRKDR